MRTIGRGAVQLPEIGFGLAHPDQQPVPLPQFDLVAAAFVERSLKRLLGIVRPEFGAARVCFAAVKQHEMIDAHRSSFPP